jgi:glycosyltransferase involved in cell wall biosynthesis
MKISIVTLSFNQAAYLRQALESILSQNYPELEYIVVDPGSTDGSRELIQTYSDRIAHIVFEPDRGAADGLNKGFALATGEICGFLNADDLLLPGSLQQVAEFFRQHPQCDMALGNGFLIDGKGAELRHISARGFTVRRYLCGGIRWLQQSTFFRRETFLRSSGFNLENRTCWDGELFVNFVNNGAVVGYIDSDLGAFRIHEASISGSDRLKQAYLQDGRRIFRQILGRDWQLQDTILRFLYRVEGVLIRLRSSLESSGKRCAR